MYRIDSCPCCTSTDLLAYPAVVAPFLASYAVRTPPFRCSLMECRNCSFRFFDSRLSPEEAERLYSGYRGEDYFCSRHRSEFWYTRKFNTGIGHDAQAIAVRKQIAEVFLKRHIDFGAITTVLDYGGDEGQFIPNTIGREKYVFDLSDAAPVQGVTKIHSECGLHEHHFDLVMICAVLEHCSDPCATLKIIRDLGGGVPSLCYVEVPYERYDLRFAGRGKLFELYLAGLLRCPPALTAVDFLSTAVRLKTNLIPPLGIMKCHEHLNYFNEKSLEALLREAGFDVMECTTVSVPSYLASGRMLQALVRARVD